MVRSSTGLGRRSVDIGTRKPSWSGLYSVPQILASLLNMSVQPFWEGIVKIEYSPAGSSLPLNQSGRSMEIFVAASAPVRQKRSQGTTRPNISRPLTVGREYLSFIVVLPMVV